MAIVRRLTDGESFDWGEGENYRVIHPGIGSRNLTLNYIRFGPGAEFFQHVHENSEDVFVVLEGSGWLKLGTEMIPIKAGDVVWVPPGEQHGTVAGPEGMVCISCQAPPDLKLYGEA